MTTSRTRAVQERRRSNAAGPHNTSKTRALQLQDALSDYTDDLRDTNDSDSDQPDTATHQ